MKKILKIAAGLFRKNGFSTTAISDIDREAAISKGTLYYHFLNIGQYFLRRFLGGVNYVLPEMRRISSYDIEPNYKLREVIKTHIISLLENLEFVAVTLRDSDKLEGEYRSNYMKLRYEHQSSLKIL